MPPKRFSSLKLAMEAAPVWTIAGYGTKVTAELDDEGKRTGWFILEIWGP